MPKETDSFYFPFFRIKITIEVTTPLKRGLLFQGVEGEKQWVQVKYERLPIFCFMCGIIGHGEDKCPTRYDAGFVEPEGELPYGSWMRVNLERRDSTRFSGEGLHVIPNTPNILGDTANKITGGETFNYSQSKDGHQHMNENINPNTGKRKEGMGTALWRRDALSSSEHTSDSRSREGQRIIKVPSQKRNAKEAELGDGSFGGKKSTLFLRDEDSMSMAETAAQSHQAL